MKRLIPATVALMMVLAVGSNPATAKVSSSPVGLECPPPFWLTDVPTIGFPAALRADRNDNDLVCAIDVALRNPERRKTVFIDDR
ncbi:MAG: hypothetical protein O7D29_00085 [Gemmatimonadetes bacterium]|nr:hypothetical protein [Gemmatimonadota bacterium]